MSKGYNEGPSVSLCKQKSNTWETYLAWFCYKLNTLKVNVTKDFIPFYRQKFGITSPTTSELQRNTSKFKCNIFKKIMAVVNKEEAPNPLVLISKSSAGASRGTEATSLRRSTCLRYCTFWYCAVLYSCLDPDSYSWCGMLDPAAVIFQLPVSIQWLRDHE